MLIVESTDDKFADYAQLGVYKGPKMSKSAEKLHLISLDHRKSELIFDSGVLQELDDFVTRKKTLKNQKLDDRTAIKLCGAYLLELVFSAPPAVLSGWSKIVQISEPRSNTKTDLERGRYEGGMKVWEGANDLAKFLDDDDSILIRKLLIENKTLRVLELGCGSGLASIALLSRLVADEDFKSEYRIHVQDYNWEVLTTLTLLNFALNLPTNFVRSLIDNRWLRFFFGDWSSFRLRIKSKSYDLIFMSETVYDSQSFNSLHDLLDKHLTECGYIILATKDTYFGLSGGLNSWLDFVESKKVFRKALVLKTNMLSIPRSILIMTRASFSVPLVET